MSVGQEVNLVELINRALNQGNHNRVYACHQSLDKDNNMLDNVLHKIATKLNTKRPIPELVSGYVYIMNCSEPPSLGEDVTTLTFFDLGVVVELNEEGSWIIIDCRDDFEINREYYAPMSLKGAPEKIRLNIPEEKTYELFDVDGVYHTYAGINVYEDDVGFYTTSSQLQDKPLESIYIFFHFTKLVNTRLDNMGKNGKFVEMAKLILNVVGVFYNKELFAHVLNSMVSFNGTGLSVSYETSFTNGLLYVGTHRKFTIVPILGNVAVCASNDTTPITFTDLDTGVSYNLFHLE